jgi:hypothetical protein
MLGFPVFHKNSFPFSPNVHTPARQSELLNSEEPLSVHSMNRRGAGHWSRIIVLDGPQSFREFLLDGHGRHRTKFPHQASRRLVGLNPLNLELFTNQWPYRPVNHSVPGTPEPFGAMQEILPAQEGHSIQERNHDRPVLPLLPFSPPGWCAQQPFDILSGRKFPVLEKETR